MREDRFAELAEGLVGIGQRFYARGWVLGTSGNFSAVVSREPLELAITASAVHKGRLERSDILRCDEHGGVIGAPTAADSPAGRGPSAETRLHLEVAKRRHAGAVLHTHSIWTTILSDLHGADGGVGVEGYEMLKGLAGVPSHAHREWIPIVENDQDMARLAVRIGAMLDRHPEAHAFLLRRHGLYTWGDSLADAERHVEILEFLFETVGRTDHLTSHNLQFTTGRAQERPGRS